MDKEQLNAAVANIIHKRHFLGGNKSCAAHFLSKVKVLISDPSKVPLGIKCPEVCFQEAEESLTKWFTDRCKQNHSENFLAEFVEDEGLCHVLESFIALELMELSENFELLHEQLRAQAITSRSLPVGKTPILQRGVTDATR
eukprot:5964400-Ditylum_brightwellii.AAC.1